MDGIVRRNGNDGVGFATESDSETFDAVVRPCRATGVLSVGGAGSLRSDRYYSIEAPPSSLAQSGGPCFDLPDDVSGLSKADADTIQEMYVRLDEIREDGLDADEVEKINGGFRSADEVTTGPGEDPGEVAEELNTLSKNGLDGFVDGTGRGEDYYKGVAGEADIATTLFKEHDIDPNDIEMNRDVPDASGANDATEVDVDLDSELTVNGNTLESPAIESKYRTVGDKNDFVIREEMVGSDGSLVDQLETQLQTDGVSNELVVVFPEGYDSKLEELGLKTEIRNELDSRVSSDYTLEFTTYTELEG